MKLLVIGSGGREHALAWRLSQSAGVEKVFVAPGNAGTALEPALENIALKSNAELIEFVRREGVAFTVVGPEAPLAAGVLSRCWPQDLRADQSGCSARKFEGFCQGFHEASPHPDC